MQIGIHEYKTNFPNLALMKLSAWHKTQGHNVSWFMPLMRYDIVYSSKVFSWMPKDDYLPSSTICGGTGYNIKTKLPGRIEHIMPDYSLYPQFNASLGFTTRGCIRNCSWCIVPQKEGAIHAHAEIEEFLRPQCKDVILMDNNILAHDHGVRQLEKTIKLNLRIDCNQGLDARLIADSIYLAMLLSRVHWIKFIRLACDKKSQMSAIEKTVKLIRNYSSKQCRFFCYVLVKDVEDALERVEFLRGLKVDPFAQPYRDLQANKEPSKESRNFARWVNHKAIFKSVKWNEYKQKRS